eukprot:jgi/Psemu1/321573/estExt_fgenesh1_pg.C_50032
MFDEDSSSDEDEKKAVDTKTTDDDGKTKTADKGEGDDGNDGNGNGNDDEDEKDSSEKKKPSTAGLFDDSSDDDDDAVFDDAGAVVGSSAPPSAKNKLGRGGNDLEGGTGGQERSAARINRTQHATVFSADRPGEGTSLHMTKMPNVVAIQPSAFDEAEYDEKNEQEEYKGYVHNMIRWRYKRDQNGTLVREGADGSLVRESNTKLVKWSDGSFTLHIGKEAFDIQNVDSSTSGGFSGLNGYVYLSQKATFKNEEDDEEDDELQNGGTVLECIGPVASRFVAKPSSLQSESHKSLTIAVRQRTVKRAKIAQYMTEEDPEKLKQERIKYNADADKLKQRKRSTGGGGGGNYRSGGGGRRPGMNRGYLEASDEEGYDTVNLRALKKGSANNYDDEMDDYGDESDDDYDQSFANRSRKRQRKAAAEEDSDDDEEMVFDDDDDDEEVKIHQKKKSTAVLDDDE